ncbi:MAG TPA: S1 family peptidase, partial [Brevundimonas sp.]
MAEGVRGRTSMARPYKAIAVAAAAITAVGLSPLVSFADERPAPSAPAAAAVDMAPGMLAAMKRDLKLDDRQVRARLATEAGAPVVEKRLRGKLGKTFAGAWIPAGKDKLTVAVTTEAAAAQARAEGADVKLVKRGESDLSAARAKMDKAGKKASKDVRGWYVDVATNSVVVMAKPGAEAAAKKFAKDAGAGSVTVVAAAEQPKPMYDIRGGDQYVINGN